MEHQTEKRICQNCKGDFIIDPEDFVFYDKIKVPPPTFCPECRLVRRLMFRNERVLFRDICRMCNKNTVTIYNPEENYIIFCEECYISDKWNPLDYGQNYDFSKPFFEQFADLQKKVPHRDAHQIFSKNTTFSNYVFNSNNVYLSFTVVDSDWIFYSRSADRSKECMDCYNIIDCESCFECVQTSKSYGSTNLIDCKDCVTSNFLFDCTNCTDCFMSSNLRNKQYVFRNIQLPKSEYLENIKKINLNKRTGVNKLKEEFDELVLNSIHRFSVVLGSQDSTGDNILRSKNVTDSFHSIESENCRFVMRTVGLKEGYDVFGSLQSELLYEAHGASRGSVNSKFFSIGNNTLNSEYCDFCTNVDNVFGCVSLNKNQYCILNRQYAKEEYFEIVEKIKKQMMDIPYIDSINRVYKYGEYFPGICMPFSYNESAASEFFYLNKNKIIDHGYKYREYNKNQYKPTILSIEALDNIIGLDSKITEEILECKHNNICDNHRCVGAFKINIEEFNFYKKYNIPIPDMCPNCRHYERLGKVHMPFLYRRDCSNGCGANFKTTYAPDRPERVYCEECYQKEVL